MKKQGFQRTGIEVSSVTEWPSKANVLSGYGKEEKKECSLNWFVHINHLENPEVVDPGWV